MSIERTTAPASEPISLQDAKDFLRVGNSAEDGLITSMIAVARETAEEYLGISMLPQVWTITQNTWWTKDDPLELPYPPLQSVDSISYIDTAGATQTLTAGTDFYVSKDREIYPTEAFDAPDLQEDTADAITIVYSTGYASSSDVPMRLKHFIKMMIGTAYLYREEITPMRINDNLKEIMNRYATNLRQLRF